MRTSHICQIMNVGTEVQAMNWTVVCRPPEIQTSLCLASTCFVLIIQDIYHFVNK